MAGLLSHPRPACLVPRRRHHPPPILTNWADETISCRNGSVNVGQCSSQTRAVLSQTPSPPVAHRTKLGGRDPSLMLERFRQSFRIRIPNTAVLFQTPSPPAAHPTKLAELTQPHV
jgi:hypothetical protein